MAIEIIHKTKLGDKNLKRIVQEIQLMKLLRYPHFIHLYTQWRRKQFIREGAHFPARSAGIKNWGCAPQFMRWASRKYLQRWRTCRFYTILLM